MKRKCWQNILIKRNTVQYKTITRCNLKSLNLCRTAQVALRQSLSLHYTGNTLHMHCTSITASKMNDPLFTEFGVIVKWLWVMWITEVFLNFSFNSFGIETSWTNLLVPYQGRGFNTGIMLLSLARLRALGWTKVWREVAREMLPIYGETSLADQDIINALLQSKPALVFKLPCQWNVQLGVLSHVDSLCRLTTARALHWNLPQKNAARLVYQHHQHFAAHFQALKRTFLELDGNLLRRRLVSCGETAAEEPKPLDVSLVSKIQRSPFVMSSSLV